MNKRTLKLTFAAWFVLAVSCSPALVPSEMPTADERAEGAERAEGTEGGQVEAQLNDPPVSEDAAPEERAPSPLEPSAAVFSDSRIPLNTLTQRRESLLHDYPDVFLQEPEPDTARVEGSWLNRTGYRVQLLSTRDVQTADDMRSQFILWSDSTFTSYLPETYLHFRQPYYRLHVGDFTNRSDAIRLARYLKRRYPDAWVVHDVIVPEQVPADTLQVVPLP